MTCTLNHMFKVKVLFVSTDRSSKPGVNARCFRR